MTRHLLVLPVLALLATSTSARSEPTASEKAVARTLFEDARVLMKGKNFALACPKLEESQRLDPGIGTLYNLGDCYEGIGRIASAWTTFSDVAEACKRAGEVDRERVARQRASALEARLPHLHVSVANPPAGLALTMDGASFGAGLVGTLVPVDPGDHELAADAPGRKRWSTRVRAEEARTVDVPVPGLEEAAPPEPTSPATTTRPETTVQPAPPPSPPPPPPLRTPWQEPVAIVAAALGVVGVGAGAYFGLKAMGDWSDAQPHCPANQCDPTGRESWSDAHQAGTYSTIAFSAGAALLATGAIVWFTRPSDIARVGLRPDGLFMVTGRLP